MTALKGFAEEDVKTLDEFGAFLHENATFSLSIDKVLAFHRLLSRYNVIRNKVAEHILEVGKLTVAPPAPDDPPSNKSRK